MSVPLTPEQRWKQARTKMRIISAREWRDFLAGRIDFLPGMTNRREILDAISKAYQAGLRDGRAENPETGERQ